MKTQLLILALLLDSVATFAQTTFTQATFDDIMKRYAQNPVNYLKTETAPDFILAGSDGKSNSLSQLISLYDGLTLTTWSYDGVIVRQYGNTGVATGILTHGYTFKTGGYPITNRELFTYVFTSPKSGQWQLVSGQHSIAPIGTLADQEAAIKKVIEGQTVAAYARDGKAYMSYWANAPYVSRVSSDAVSAVSKLVGDEFRKAITESGAKSTEPVKDKVTRENYVIRVNGNSAFVIFDQHNERPDGTVRHSVEERYLERINTEWKLVNVTVLVTK